MNEQKRTTSVTAPLRVGIIGGGGIASAHLAGYRAHADRITAVAVADLSPDLLAMRAEQDGLTGYTDYRRMLADEQLDAVDICLPHHLHTEAIVAAAEVGVHVLCEKPICTTLDDAARIAAAVEASGIVLMCAHNQVFRPAVQRLRELVATRQLGTIYSASTTCEFELELTEENAGWRARAAESGGGQLLDSGYHPTYVLRHIVGDEPATVSAVLANHRLSFLPGEDSAQVTVRFASGAIGRVSTSWAFDGLPDPETITVNGSRGSAFGTDRSLTVSIVGHDPVTVPLDPIDTFAAEIAHFAEVLRDGGAPVQGHEDGIATLSLILAAYEAASSGTTVAL